MRRQLTILLCIHFYSKYQNLNVHCFNFLSLLKKVTVTTSGVSTFTKGCGKDCEQVTIGEVNKDEEIIRTNCCQKDLCNSGSNLQGF